MKKLNLLCPISTTGYGITSLNIYKELRKKADICLFPLGNPSVDNDEDKNIAIQDIQKQSSYDPKSACFKIWHQFDLASRIGFGKYSALTFFEIDRLKPIEVHMINCLDTIFVASKWAKDILIENNININIEISPLAADNKIFNTLVKDNRKNNNYVFLNIGKWEIRKGHDFLLEVFNDAFDKNDNVELWVLGYNPFLSEEENNKWIKLYKDSKLGDKIKIIPRLQTHTDVANLIAMSDCGIFPSRAEGWNNEVMEMMCMNKPIILTNYSAHTEYANKNNSYLIEIDSLTKAIDSRFFDGYGNWASLSDNQYEQTIEHMRFVYNNNIKINPEGLKTSQQYSWENTANIIYNNLYKE